MEEMNEKKMRAVHWVIMGFIVIALILVSLFIKELSIYSFIIAVSVVGFMLYLKVIEKISAFENINYNNVLTAKLFAESVRSFRGEFTRVCLTGEDVIPNKTLFNCCGFFSCSFDTLKQKLLNKTDNIGKKTLNEINKIIINSEERESLEIWGFFNQLYDNSKIIKFFQTIVPKIPIISGILRKIPMIRDYCFPTPKCLITTRDRIMFKGSIVEIRGKSIMPLSINPEFNAFSVVEYNNKYDETRLIEKFIFVKEIYADLINEISVISKNAVNVASQLNPQVKVEQEASITKRS